MADKTIGRTAQLARKLVNRLPKTMDNELKELIARAESGQEDTTTEIMDLLSQHENSLLWLLEQLNVQDGQRGITRGYDPLPGWQSSIPASEKWYCPRTGCAETLPVIRDGEDPPLCDVHKTVMKR